VVSWNKIDPKGNSPADARIRPALPHSNAVLKNEVGEAKNLRGRLKPLEGPIVIVLPPLSWGSQESARQIETGANVLLVIAERNVGEAKNLRGRLKHYSEPDWEQLFQLGKPRICAAD